MSDPILEEFDLSERDLALFKALTAWMEENLAPKSGGWDRTYKGDSPWLEFRAAVIRQIRRSPGHYITEATADPRTKELVDIRSRKQWHRAVTQHLIPNKPQGTDGMEFVNIQVRPRGVIYTTLREYAHCAIPAVVEGKENARGLISDLRKQYEVASRADCRGCEEKQNAYYNGPEGSRNPSTPSHDTPPEELTDEEKAILGVSVTSHAQGV